MAAHPKLPIGRRFAANPLLRALAWSYLALWLVAALAPLDRMTWLLENGLVFALVLLLVTTHRRFAFSNVSHVSIFLFLVLHVVGSHYTYSLVPAGDWVKDALDLSRNHYDRLVHFAFGLLLAYPLRELTLRVGHVHGVPGYLAPVFVVLAFSSIYEIIESFAAQLADPAVGLAYVGAQGDVWDGQKDMALACVGAVVAMLLAALHHRIRGREAYLY